MKFKLNDDQMKLINNHLDELEVNNFVGIAAEAQFKGRYSDAIMIALFFKYELNTDVKFGNNTYIELLRQSAEKTIEKYPNQDIRISCNDIYFKIDENFSVVVNSSFNNVFVPCVQYSIYGFTDGDKLEILGGRIRNYYRDKVRIINSEYYPSTGIGKINLECSSVYTISDVPVNIIDIGQKMITQFYKCCKDIQEYGLKENFFVM